MVICVIETFFVYFSTYSSCYHLLVSSAPLRSLQFLPVIVSIFFSKKYPLSIFNFLEETSSLSIILLSSISLHYSLRKLSYVSLLFSGILHLVGYIFPFLLCFSLLFFSQLFVRSPQTTTFFTFLHFFFYGIVLITASCTML